MSSNTRTLRWSHFLPAREKRGCTGWGETSDAHLPGLLDVTSQSIVVTVVFAGGFSLTPGQGSRYNTWLKIGIVRLSRMVARVTWIEAGNLVEPEQAGLVQDGENSSRV